MARKYIRVPHRRKAYDTPVPLGSIWFLDSAVIPDGWTRYSSADGDRIIGAGLTYAVDDNGGSNLLTLSSKTSDSVGGHTGNTLSTKKYAAAGANNACNQTMGAHTQNFSHAEAALEPNYQQLVMAQADSAKPLHRFCHPLLRHPGQYHSHRYLRRLGQDRRNPYLRHYSSVYGNQRQARRLGLWP